MFKTLVLLNIFVKTDIFLFKIFLQNRRFKNRTFIYLVVSNFIILTFPF